VSSTEWNILSLDPGLRTGVAVYSPDGGVRTSTLDPDEVGDFVIDWCLSVTASERRNLIVCESFTITLATAKKTAQPWSLELIGVCRFLAQHFGVEFLLQTPKSAHVFGTNEKLKDIGWWKPNKEDHEQMACRHLLLALAARRLPTPEMIR
jgi:hypothetical protein